MPIDISGKPCDWLLRFFFNSHFMSRNLHIIINQISQYSRPPIWSGFNILKGGCAFDFSLELLCHFWFLLHKISQRIRQFLVIINTALPGNTKVKRMNKSEIRRLFRCPFPLALKKNFLAEEPFRTEYLNLKCTDSHVLMAGRSNIVLWPMRPVFLTNNFNWAMCFWTLIEPGAVVSSHGSVIFCIPRVNNLIGDARSSSRKEPRLSWCVVETFCCNPNRTLSTVWLWTGDYGLLSFPSRFLNSLPSPYTRNSEDHQIIRHFPCFANAFNDAVGGRLFNTPILISCPPATTFSKWFYTIPGCPPPGLLTTSPRRISFLDDGMLPALSTISPKCKDCGNVRGILVATVEWDDSICVGWQAGDDLGSLVSTSWYG